MIKILFVLLILCTAALVAVGIGILLRVRRHLGKGQTDGQATCPNRTTSPGDR